MIVSAVSSFLTDTATNYYFIYIENIWIHKNREVFGKIQM